MSYRFIDANELISEVDFKTQDIINNMDCVYVDGIKTCNQHFNLEEHDAEIRADERKRVLEEVAKALNTHCEVDCTGCCYECNAVELIEIVEQMKGEQT